MEFSCQRAHLIKPLQKVTGLLTTRPSLPILSHLLITAQSSSLRITARDWDCELSVELPLEGVQQEGSMVVSGRKLLELCKALSEDAVLQLVGCRHQLVLRAERNCYRLASLPVSQFPVFDNLHPVQDLETAAFEVSQRSLRRALEATQFAMARQDIRLYLNGMLWDLNKKNLKLVTSDGHRLGYYELILSNVQSRQESMQYLLSRRAAIEMLRLLEDSNEKAQLTINPQQVSLKLPSVQFTSQLLEGKFPGYQRFFGKHDAFCAEIPRELFKQALTRAAIFSHEEQRVVTLKLTTNHLSISAKNNTQETAEEELNIAYEGPPLELGFNIQYLLEVLQVLKGSALQFLATNAVAGVEIKDLTERQARYVIMPVRL